MTAPTMFVVRVITRGREWTSPGMTEDAADILADQVEDNVLQHEGGYGFIAFTARGDRQLAIRAREIVSIEVRPEHNPDGGRVVPINGAQAMHAIAGAPR